MRSAGITRKIIVVVVVILSSVYFRLVLIVRFGWDSLLSLFIFVFFDMKF